MLNGGMAELKDRLRHFMERAALTPQQFADRVGVDVSAVSLWVNGRAKPKWERLPQILEALGVDGPTFFGDLAVEADADKAAG